jgi:hypothetical protein
MMTSTNATTKHLCLVAFAELQELEIEAGIPEAERVALPANFNRLRKPERFEALTAEFETRAAECREALKTHEAEKVLVQVASATELKVARKRCLRELENLDRLRRKAGMKPIERVSLKEMSLEGLKELETRLRVDVLSTIAEIKATVEAETSAKHAERERREAEAAKKAEAEHAEAKSLVERYRKAINELRGLDKIEASRRYHPCPERVARQRVENLRAMLEGVLEAISRIRLERIRERHERDQRSLADYRAHQRSGRAGKPYGVWLKERRATG